MSVDAAQIETPPAQPPATSINLDVSALAGPILQQAAATATSAANQVVGTVKADVLDVANKLHEDSLDAIAAGDAGLDARISALETQAQAAVGGVLTNIESDPVTQRYLILAIVGGLIVGALAVLIAALLGNSEAQRYIGGVPAVAGALVLWVSKAGVSLPSKGATKAPAS